jgi:GntR family transcriptional regulator/MocR family aminotransferase
VLDLAPWPPPGARREPPLPCDFRYGVPALTDFPQRIWSRLVSRRAQRMSLRTLGYGRTLGFPSLREAIAHYLARARGVTTTPDQIVVVNGSQQALDLIARLLIDGGDRVVFEEPGYQGARQVFQAAGAEVVPVRVDADGLQVSDLPGRARLAYVTPSHQFPLGGVLPMERRLDLLQWAASSGAYVVEDDYDSEFRFGGRPLETLSAIDESGRVIYVGSFSKSLLPALRVGFLVAPRSLRGPLRAASYVASWHVQWPAQAALHVRRARRAYAARHERILRCLESDFAPWVAPVPSVTGMHLAARIRSGSLRLEREVADRARIGGVAIGRLSTYFASSVPQPGLLLGYGAISEARIQEGLKKLRECFAAAHRS